MNTYSTTFTCIDPASEHPFLYTFKVRTPPQLMVAAGDLVAAALIIGKKKRTVDEIADTLKTMFPGKHTLTCTQFGVKMKLQRDGTA